MTRYKYKARNTDGHVIRGVLHVEDENDLREVLSARGYYLISSSKVRDTSEFFSDFQEIKMIDITNFCRQFGIMLKAGISISKSLETLSTTTQNRKMKKILSEVYSDVINGGKISDSFNKYPKIFPLFFVNMTRIGELSGSLDLVMLRLAEYYDKDTQTKRKAKSALAYPIFLLCLVFAVLIVLAVFVMPMFDDLFKSFNAELPSITKAVIVVSDFIKNNILYIILVVACLFLFIRIYSRTPKGRLQIDTVKLKLPIIGTVTKSVVTSRFASGFATLLQSGLQLVDAVDIMGKLLGNKSVEQKFEVCKTELRRGKKVSKAIATANIFPNMLIEMVAVGENSGQLESVLKVTSDYYDNQVDYDIKRATAAIEPIMIIFIALIVVVVLLAVFLPMLGLMDAIEGTTGY